MKHASLVAIVSVFTAAACAAPVAVPTSSPHETPAVSASAPASSGPCDRAKALRARVPQLLDQGKLDRTVRLIRRADDLCPAQQQESWGALVSTFAELGLWNEMRQVAAQIDLVDGRPELKDAARAAREKAARFDKTFPDTDDAKKEMETVFLRAVKARDDGVDAEALQLFEQAWGLWRPNGQALIEAGLLAKKGGKDSQAQRLFDRGRVELETFPTSGDATKLASHMVVEAREDLGTVKGWSTSGMLADARSGRVSIVTLSLEERLRFDAPGVTMYGSFAFSPDGRKLAAGPSGVGAAFLWDVVTGNQIATYKEARDLSWASDGSEMHFSAGGNRVVWNLRTGSQTLSREPSTKPSRPRAVVKTARRKPGARPALTYWLDANSPIDADEIVCGEESRPTCPESGRIISAGNSELSPDGTTRATEWQRQEAGCVWQCVSYHMVILKDAATGHELRRLSPCGKPAFSPDGKTLVSQGGGGFADNAIRLWNVETGRMIAEFEGASWLFSPDGSKLAVFVHDATHARTLLKLYRTSDGMSLPVPEIPVGKDIKYVLTPDGYVDFDDDAISGLLLCRLRQFVFPFQVCEERYRVRGLLGKLIAGEPYAEP